MDPKHRDRLAFMRVCSGIFRRDMPVVHTRTGERLKLASSHRIFGRDRETVDEAWPGDVVGLVGRDGLRIGDTLADDPTLAFDAIPAFAPEVFAWLHAASPAQFKGFRKGLDQLLQEGVVQAFQLDDATRRVPLLGAVGPLQFDVVQFRLKDEYRVESTLESAPWTVLRWVHAGEVDPARLVTGAQRAIDGAGREVILFQDEWTCRYFTETHKDVRLAAIPPTPAPAEEAPRR
jgi:peptide chain release factor 3